MVDVKDLTKKFGDITAVDSLTFHVDRGEIFGLLGPNGAGKTTTIRMLCCLISRTSGEARIAGYSLGNKADSLAIRKLIGLVPDNIGLYEEMSAHENLDYYGKLYETPEPRRKKKIDELLTLLDLREQRERPVSGYSKGMKQKVAIARALVHDPELLFFDEPTANLDPESSSVVREFILRLKREGKTIFLNTHNLDEAQRVCDRIGILKTRLLALSTPGELEKRAGNSRTVFEVEEVGARMLEAVKKLKPVDLGVEDNRLVITVADPQKEIPDYVREIVSAGGRIRSVTPLTPSLEETYLKVVREAE
jgi:ABC-2 type transport system ATP-binding protein